MNSANTIALPSGFHEPVFDSQDAFRAAMMALANPGRLCPAGRGLGSTPLPAAATALVLSLCDFETKLYLAPSIATGTGAAEYLRFYTDAMLVDDPSDAAFAVVDLARDGLDLPIFAKGSADYPDRSATVIAMATSLSCGAPWVLAGPGIAKTAYLRVEGLGRDFADQWRANRALFPLGVDILFATSDAVVGLPRSTRIIEECR